MKDVNQCIYAGILYVVFFLMCTQAKAGGALCLYQDSDGNIICSSYSNSGVGAESNCRAEARASNPICGFSPAAINAAAGSCASQIFGSPSVCLDDVSPYNALHYNEAQCNTDGDRWCPSTYYGFFVGNSGCQDAICAAAQGILPAELIDFSVEWDDGYNVINWSTSSEYNTSHFTVTQYTDFIGDGIQVQFSAAGVSSELQEYTMKHKDPEKTINYYLLDQVDIDGKRMQYGPISIDNSDHKRKITKMVDMMGQEVDEFYQGIVIVIYDDGTTEKKYQQ